MIKILFKILLICLLGCSVSAEIVVNEVLANEPGSNSSLEWVELFNDSIEAVSLAGYSLTFANTTISLPASVTLGAGEYFIVCQKLYGDPSSPGFEARWGDSSGVWGDDPIEQNIQTPFDPVISFTLLNGSGSVLVRKDGTPVSALFWDEVGIDGYSWEKIYPAQDSVAQSVSRNGSTPGRLNSVAPVSRDLALDSIYIAMDEGAPIYYMVVTNRGQNQISSAVLYVNTIARHPGLSPLYQFDLPLINVSESYTLIVTLTFDGIYENLIAYLSSDVRVENDTLEFTGVGILYPPLRLNEFLSNPQSPLGSEWIEIKNISNIPVDLNGWQIGDAISKHLITSQSPILNPGEYVTLVQLSTSFYSYYPNFNSLLIEPSGWSVLNNNNDQVKLFDRYNILADKIDYNEVYSENFTHSRSETEGREYLWGRSLESGGTPGEVNTLLSENIGSSLNASVEPEYISPDNDGTDENVTITVIAPEADSYSMKIYDRYGRIVRTLYDETSFLPIETEWDGLNDDGRRLPIGIYIIFIEAVGVESTKIPVVVAR